MKIQTMNLMAKKMMIVDERALSRHLVRQASTTPLDTVLECTSPEEAIKAIGAFRPDCVMMGVSTPEPATIKAIKTIRKYHPEVRVLAVSSLHEPELKQAANKAGADGYVSNENLSELFLLAAPERLTMPETKHRNPGK
jgi:two-component system, NarL family, invasion response regulator UvrY